MVLIDIDMPNCCAECPLFDDRWDYPTCYVTNVSRGYNFDIFNKKMDSCPLSISIIQKAIDLTIKD